ncbi:MAG: anion permease [Hyphomicrobium sp.]|nr:anion permease [Hyphomicrobium sp.]
MTTSAHPPVSSAPSDASAVPSVASSGKNVTHNGSGADDWLNMLAQHAAQASNFVVPLTLALSLSILIWALPQELSVEGRKVLIVLALAIIGWTMTSLGDSTVAIAAVIALAVSGTIESDDLYQSLGHELIWLLIAAFLIAAVLRSGGLIEPLVLAMTGSFVSVPRLFYGLTASISATALVIPSTSARAALLLPVFLVLAHQIRSRPIVRALALLFPTVILLSASGSLIGAGAHVLAAEVMANDGGRTVGYLGWMMLAMPIALLSSFAATSIILNGFLSPALRTRQLRLARPPSIPKSWQHRAILVVLLSTICLWILQPWHGLGLGVVALASAFVLLKLSQTFLKPKDAFKAVEIELILFLAATFTLADAMTDADVDEWLAASFKSVVPGLANWHEGLVIAAMAIIALLAHLVITSRTARAAVLIPSCVLPLVELGGDITTLVMVTMVGTGLCQTMSASAKPVAIFSNAPIPTYTSGDLMRLSAGLMPMMFVLIMVFALFVWPAFD